MKSKPRPLEHIDYVLTNGHSWLTCGPFSVRVQHLYEDSCLKLAVYPLGREDEEPLHEFVMYDEEVPDEDQDE